MQHVITSTPITSDEQWHAMRARNVGCSEVAALVGVHEYATGYGLAARKLGRLQDTIDSKVLRRGRLLEPVAKTLLAEMRPDWKQIPATSYFEDTAARWGATPDLFVRTDRGLGIVQIKTVAPQVFASKWHNDAGELEPPLWIAIQAMSEQHLTGADFAFVAALVVGYGLDLELIEVPYLPAMIDKLREKLAAFWQLVDAGQLPAPDYGLDHDVLSQILREDDGSEIDLTGDNELPEIVARLDAARHAKGIAEDMAKEQSARLLHRIGSAAVVKFAGGVIKAPTVHRKEYVAKATSYRKVSLKFDRARAEVSA